MRNEGSKLVRIFLRIRLLVLSLLTTVVIAACQKTANQLSNGAASIVSPTTTDCRTIEHVMGETDVCGQPHRIVVLGSYILEPLIALGMQPVGFGDHFAPHQGDYTNPNQQIPYLGRYITQPLANVGDGFNPSIEAIIQVKPDLILGDNANANQYEILSKIAPTLLLDRFAPNAHLRIIAQAVDRSEQVEQILTETDQRIASARETLATVIATYPKALLLGSSQLKKISVYSNSPNTNNQCGSLVEELGFKLVYPLDFGEVPRASPMPISLEILPQLNEADLVILFGHNFSKVEQLNGLNDFEAHSLSNLKQAWQESEIAQSLNASKIGRVYFIPTYLCGGLPGPIGAKFYLEELKEQLLSSN